MYSAQVLDHFQRPRNVGEVVQPDITVQLENPACGDILKLTLKVRADRIEQVRFLAKGCVPAIACGSLLAEIIEGLTVDQAGKLTKEEMVQTLGGLPEASGHAAHLAIDALQAALKRITTRSV